MNYISNISAHPKRKAIEERTKILEFFDRFGAEATREAFGKSRSTIYLWKKKLKLEGGRLSALAPGDTKPRVFRVSGLDPRITDFVLRYRQLHPGVGKEVIKTELDEHCQVNDIRTISESTIGRVIKSLKERGQIPKISKLSYYARTGLMKERAIEKKKKLRRKGYQPESPGDLVQIDSIVIFTNGLKRYIVTAIDQKSRFAFAYGYSSHSSMAARDFVTKFRDVAPFCLKRVQTDNGSEFHEHFRDYLEKENIIHFFNYPRSPKSNAYIERFNRTIQEQYISWHLDEMEDLSQFNQGLMGYLVWYNTRKVHKSLGNVPPLKYFLDNYITNQEKSNMLWTLT